jgi:hypothetical protein
VLRIRPVRVFSRAEDFDRSNQSPPSTSYTSINLYSGNPTILVTRGEYDILHLVSFFYMLQAVCSACVAYESGPFAQDSISARSPDTWMSTRHHHRDEPSAFFPRFINWIHFLINTREPSTRLDRVSWPAPVCKHLTCGG